VVRTAQPSWLVEAVTVTAALKPLLEAAIGRTDADLAVAAHARWARETADAIATAEVDAVAVPTGRAVTAAVAIVRGAGCRRWWWRWRGRRSSRLADALSAITQPGAALEAGVAGGRISGWFAGALADRLPAAIGVRHRVARPAVVAPALLTFLDPRRLAPGAGPRSSPSGRVVPSWR
jgi:hypothetical protein